MLELAFSILYDSNCQLNFIAPDKHEVRGLGNGLTHERKIRRKGSSKEEMPLLIEYCLRKSWIKGRLSTWSRHLNNHQLPQLRILQPCVLSSFAVTKCLMSLGITDYIGPLFPEVWVCAQLHLDECTWRGNLLASWRQGGRERGKGQCLSIPYVDMPSKCRTLSSGATSWKCQPFLIVLL